MRIVGLYSDQTNAETNACCVNYRRRCHSVDLRPLIKEQVGFCLWRWGLVGCMMVVEDRTQISKEGDINLVPRE